MNTRFPSAPSSGSPSEVVLLFPPRGEAASTGARAHFWTQWQAYAEKKRRQIAEAFRGELRHEAEDNFTALAFPTFARVGAGDEMPPEAA